MKTFNIVIASLVALGIFFGFVACAWAEPYPRAFVVEEVDYNNDLVIFCDSNGEQWVWEGVEDWMVNDFAAAIMDDNNTPTIYDDKIIKVYYQGVFDNWVTNEARRN